MHTTVLKKFHIAQLCLNNLQTKEKREYTNATLQLDYKSFEKISINSPLNMASTLF